MCKHFVQILVKSYITTIILLYSFLVPTRATRAHPRILAITTIHVSSYFTVIILLYNLILTDLPLF